MKKSIFSVLLLTVVLLAGCRKTPEACFTADKTTAAASETITFTSCAENAETTEWTMGDGTTKTGNSVTHTYSEPGVYLVTQRVETKNGKRNDQISQLITVPEPPQHRYITQIRVTSFATLKPNGDQWDGQLSGGVEPDIYLLFSIDGSTWSLRTPVYENAKAENLPIIYDLAPDNILLTNATWKVEMRDDDLFGASFDPMANWPINPATAGSNGIITLEDASNNKVEIRYETR